MRLLACSLFLIAPLAFGAGPVKPGDTLGAVQAVMGAPRGRVTLAGRQLLYYERGEVELRAGTVTRVALRSVEEHAAWSARRLVALENSRMAEESYRVRLLTEGTALMRHQQTDPVFLGAAPDVQVTFWTNFARHYPGVDCTAQLVDARNRLDQQTERERIAQLEIRVEAAEARATAAEANVARRWIVAYPTGRNRHRYDSSPGLWPIEYHFASGDLTRVAPKREHRSASMGDSFEQNRRQDSLGREHQEQWEPSCEADGFMARSDRRYRL